MAELKKSKKIRVGHRSDVTKRIAAAAALMEDFEPSKKSQLEAIHTILLSKYTLLKELDSKILDALLDDETATDDAMEDEVAGATDYEFRIQTTLEDIKKELKWVGSGGAVDDGDGGSVSSGGSTTSSERKRRVVKLPKIEVEKFSGDPKKWQEWWDAFNSLIHTSDLSDYDKFYYLRSYLLGDAKNAIGGLQATEANYQHAIQLLTERFGKKSLVISSHMEALMKVSALSDKDDTKKIRRVYDKIECHIRSLQALGLDSANYGCVLGPVILSQLPDELRLTVTRNFDATADVWELDEILKALKTEIEVRERSGFVSSTKKSNDERDRGSASTLYTQDAAKEGAGVQNCVFCKGKHSSRGCKVVTEVEARRQILRKKAKCFNCFGGGHIAPRCKSNKVCAKCGEKHDTSLCSDGAVAKDPPKEEPPKEPPKEKKTDTTMHMFCSRATSVLLLTGRAVITNPNNSGRSVCARLIFDNCSNRTYITDQLREALGLKKVGNHEVNISRFMDKEDEDSPPLIHTCDLVQFRIKGVDGAEDVVVTGGTVPSICPPPHSRAIELCKDEYRHLEDITLADEVVEEPFRGDSIDVMIGMDFYYQIVFDKTKRGVCGPVATQTRIGWLVAGPIYSETDSAQPSVTMVAMSEDKASENEVVVDSTDKLEELVQQFWSLSVIGITEDEDSEDVLRRFEESIWFNQQSGRYSVSLPWRRTPLLLADNYRMCMKYLLCRLKEFRRDPKLYEEYKKIFDEQLKLGVLEPVPSDPPDVGKAYYIPHHCVIRPDRTTTKYRVVYNGSSSMVGPTLNQCLHKGPSLMPDIVRILMGFGLNQIAVVADLEKAFLNIEVDETDRDYLRTVWVKDFDPTSQDQNVEFVNLRFTRCVFGVSSSPFHLMATTKHHTEKYRELFPDIVEKIQTTMFVDDLNAGGDSVEEGYKLYTVGKRIFSEAGHNLRKFATNSAELRALVQLEEDGPGNMLLENVPCETYAELTPQSIEKAQPLVEQKVLGMIWDKEADEWVFRFDTLLEVAAKIKRTKKGLLQIYPRVYDPVGFISPVTLKMKVLFQSTCVAGLRWDDELSKEQVDIVDSWLNDLKEAGEIRFPRYSLRFPRSSLSNVQLIGFSDASMLAYGAVIYLRVESDEGVDVNIVTSKSRVAPVKKMTIPRLELVGCLCLARLMKKAKEVVLQNVSIDEEHFFTDSMTALCWIQNECQQYKQFVEERNIKIRKLTDVSKWKHVKGPDNPADLLTRGILASQLKNNRFWPNGPEYLPLAPIKWPVKVRDVEHTEESLEEMRTEDKKKMDTQIVLTTCDKGSVVMTGNIGEIMDCTRYGSLQKLKRVTGHVKRFIHNMRNPTSRKTGELDANELKEAELLWVHSMQRCLRNDPKYSRMERQLSIFNDEMGILRCKGRFEKSKLISNQKCPIILPARHHVVSLIVREAHNRVLHNGVNDTMVYIRETYWIPRLRQLARSLLHKCVLCRWIEGLSYSPPPFPPLPECRVAMEEPFSTTGVDYAGPMFLKSIETETKQSKVYILLSTCATTRAVHLELTPDLGSSACIRGLRRFIARRGAPKMVISDNAKTFKSAEVRKFLADRGISWKFNVPRAPWTGGFFERMVKSTKRCLKKVLKNSSLSYEELETVLVEVENVINNRPLSYIDTDSTEEILTPNHLLCGRAIHIANRDVDTEQPTDVRKPCFRKRVLYRQKLLKDFGKRWENEYLANLRGLQRMPKTNQLRMPKIDDVVLVHGESPRLSWRLGRIVKLHSSDDGIVRRASVRLSGKGKVVDRAVKMLYPLEESSNENSVNDSTNQDVEIDKTDDVHHDEDLRERADVDITGEDHEQSSSSNVIEGRPRRTAAIEGERRRKNVKFAN